MQELEDSLACVHTATDAATALNKIYTSMHEKSPEGGLFLKRWAKVLLRPELRHIESACDALEQAILGHAGAPLPSNEEIARASCSSCNLPSLMHEAVMSQCPHGCSPPVANSVSPWTWSA